MRKMCGAGWLRAKLLLGEAGCGLNCNVRCDMRAQISILRRALIHRLCVSKQLEQSQLQFTKIGRMEHWEVYTFFSSAIQTLGMGMCGLFSAFTFMSTIPFLE